MLMDHPKSFLINCLLEIDPSSVRKCPLPRGSPLPVTVDMGEQRRCTWLSLERLWLAIQVQDLSWDQLRLCCNCTTVNFSLFPILLPSLPYRWVPAGLASITWEGLERPVLLLSCLEDWALKWQYTHHQVFFPKFHGQWTHFHSSLSILHVSW